jgi:formate C-acetyltransferase
MLSPTLQVREPPATSWELVPGSRSDLLREMYWAKAHERARVRKPVQGCGEEGLVGHARDFAALLEASDAYIQEHERIVGCSLAVPEDPESLNLGHYDPHYPPGLATLLRLGLAGIRDQARAQLGGETDAGKREFLRAVEISYHAACAYVAQYATLAREMASAEDDPVRRDELEEIAAVCDELAAAAPSTFYAALQLVQFVRVLGGRGCIGRFDQWLYPFYRRDIERERLTPEQALELLEDAFIKFNYFPAAYQAANDTLRNISLAGQTLEGEDGANELTYACLAASAKLRLPEPKINVRFFEGSPPRLMDECCRFLAVGTNVLAVYNDEVVLPALDRLGIPIEDARQYCNDGCEEIIIGGMCTIRFRVHDSLPLLTETAYAAEQRPFATFEQVMDDYNARLQRYMPQDDPQDNPITFPFFAASIEDCLAQASTTGARYNLYGSILSQVGDTADGLAAIQKLIYEESKLGWDEFIAALRADYEGYEGLRQMVRNRAPKYGNDDDRVDALVKEITERFCDSVHATTCDNDSANVTGPGFKRAAGLMCFGIHQKANLPASPDGRRQGDMTANSFSPAVGMDRSGPTAVLRSVAKVDLTKASHGSVLDLALHDSVLRGEDALEKLNALVRSFLQMGCTATLQLNILDRETLLRARENPDAPEYRNLIVRVWGFSAVFVELPRGLQDHVLARTEHGM